MKRVDGKTIITYTVNVITGIYDFTLAADPAYPDTSCELREFVKELKTPEPENPQEENKMREQVREMRRAAAQKLHIV